MSIQENQHSALVSAANSLKNEYLSAFNDLYLALDCVQLALVQKQIVQVDSNFDDFTKNTLKRERDVIPHKKEKLHDKKDIFYYNNQPCPSKILIEGGPGVGKSTLVLQICREWARGDLLREFKLVLLIILREYRDMSLENTMKSLLRENAYQELHNSEGSSVMLILDGYDEISMSKRSDRFLINILKGHILPKVTFVIAGRSHACTHLNGFNRRVEVLGFSREQIQEFIQKLTCEHSAEEFLNNLENNPCISNLFHIPVCLTMIVNVLNFNQMLPSNLTELLKKFVISMFVKQKETFRYSESMTINDGTIHQTVAEMLPGIPREAIGTILSLGKIAYWAFFESYTRDNKDYVQETKMIFTVNELVSCGVLRPDRFDGGGFFQTTHIHLLPKNTVVYNFIHLTVQEFFCALHVALLPTAQQYKLVHEHFTDFPHMFCYYFGLSRPLSSKIFDSICSKLTESLTKSDGIITKCAIKCIFESQSKETALNPFVINLSYQTLLPYDCLCIAYLLSHFSVVQLRLWACGIGNKEAKLLAKPGVINSGIIEILDLHWNDIGSDGIEYIVNTMNASMCDCVFRYLCVFAL